MGIGNNATTIERRMDLEKTHNRDSWHLNESLEIIHPSILDPAVRILCEGLLWEDCELLVRNSGRELFSHVLRSKWHIVTAVSYLPCSCQAWDNTFLYQKLQYAISGMPGDRGWKLISKTCRTRREKKNTSRYLRYCLPLWERSVQETTSGITFTYPFRARCCNRFLLRECWMGLVVSWSAAAARLRETPRRWRLECNMQYGLYAWGHRGGGSI